MKKLLFAVLMISLISDAEARRDLSDEAHYNWLHMQGNLLAQQKLLKLSEVKAKDMLFVNVNLVDVIDGRIADWEVR